MILRTGYGLPVAPTPAGPLRTCWTSSQPPQPLPIPPSRPGNLKIS